MGWGLASYDYHCLISIIKNKTYYNFITKVKKLQLTVISIREMPILLVKLHAINPGPAAD